MKKGIIYLLAIVAVLVAAYFSYKEPIDNWFSENWFAKKETEDKNKGVEKKPQKEENKSINEKPVNEESGKYVGTISEKENKFFMSFKINREEYAQVSGAEEYQKPSYTAKGKLETNGMFLKYKRIIDNNDRNYFLYEYDKKKDIFGVIEFHGSDLDDEEVSDIVTSFVLSRSPEASQEEVDRVVTRAIASEGSGRYNSIIVEDCYYNMYHTAGIFIFSAEPAQWKEAHFSQTKTGFEAAFNKALPGYIGIETVEENTTATPNEIMYSAKIKGKNIAIHYYVENKYIKEVGIYTTMPEDQSLDMSKVEVESYLKATIKGASPTYNDQEVRNIVKNLFDVNGTLKTNVEYVSKEHKFTMERTGTGFSFTMSLYFGN